MEQARTALCHYCPAGQRPALLIIERKIIMSKLMIDEKRCVIVYYESDEVDYIEDQEFHHLQEQVFGQELYEQNEPIWDDILQAVRDFRTKIGFAATDTDPLAQFHNKDLIEVILNAMNDSADAHHVGNNSELTEWFDILSLADENNGYVEAIFDDNGLKV